MSEAEIRALIELARVIGPWGILLVTIAILYFKYERHGMDANCAKQASLCDAKFKEITSQIELNKDHAGYAASNDLKGYQENKSRIDLLDRRFEEIKEQLHGIDVKVVQIAAKLNMNGGSK